jgi:hypothetical protein
VKNLLRKDFVAAGDTFQAMDAKTDREDQQSVLRALDLPSISPVLDRTGSSIAKRTGLAPERVAEILGQLDRNRPRVVRQIRGRQTGAYWVSNTFARRLCNCS